MLKLLPLLALALTVGAWNAAADETSLTLHAGALRITLDGTGHVVGVQDSIDGTEYAPVGAAGPVLALEREGVVTEPTAMRALPGESALEFSYGDAGARATVRFHARPTHLSLELTGLTGPTPDRVHWGPIVTSMAGSIGETLGVIRGERFALGIQALNARTVGGAREAGPGSALFAWCKDYSRVDAADRPDRLDRPALPEPLGSVVGSKVALFGCPVAQTLAVIGAIEVAEGLPHPLLDGVWAKVSPEATRSYLIAPFSEANVDLVLDVAEQAGLKYIYHGNPFRSWGHFELHREAFPDGVESLRRCVGLATARGIGVGVHTLSNFIQPNDPYVTPVPDARLVRRGAATLTEAVDDAADTIPVNEPGPFRERQTLGTVLLEAELVQYDRVSEAAPWRLLGCERGAFGTRATGHVAGSAVGKLWDHDYGTFFPNLEMQDEMALRLGELFNQTGLRQISFDGLEGCDVTGYGAYAEARFVQTVFDTWDHDVINDSSQLKHFTWHMHTRMNWGEPWGKAMRESMPEYRFKNQAYFERNLLPPMLGWFELRSASDTLEATSLDEVEWVLAKGAGFGAGCAWHTSLYALDRLGNRDALLEAIRQWDALRHEGAFSEEQRAMLRDPAREFHLDTTGETPFLVPVSFSPPLRYAPSPGEGPTRWTVSNPFQEQALQFTLRVAPGENAATLTNPIFTLDGKALRLPVQVASGQYLVLDRSGRATVYDGDWHVLDAVQVKDKVPRLAAGKQEIGLEAGPVDKLSMIAEVRFKTMGEVESVGAVRSIHDRRKPAQGVLAPAFP